MSRLTLATSLLFCVLILSAPLWAQLGGATTYGYLDLSPSARITGLGGNAIATLDEDLNLGYANPALYNPSMHGSIAFNNAFYPSGINHGYVAYAHDVEKWKATFGGGLSYVQYGRFDGRDPSGVSQGEFGAGEYVLQAGGAYRASKLSYGANLKLLWSHLESYNSVGMAVDVGAVFNDTASQFTASLLLRNLGFQFKPYTPGNREELPFEIQLGVSKRLEHLPLRLSLILHNLQTWDIRYDDPNAPVDDNLFQNPDDDTEKKYIGDKIFRHVIVNGEFYFGSSFFVRFGYNHLVRSELAFEARPGLSGFSTGVGIRIKQFRFDYGFQSQNKAGGEHQIGISTNLDAFGTRKRSIEG